MGTFHRLPAGRQFFQIQRTEILNSSQPLIPPIQGFDVNGTDASESLTHQIGDEMPADKAPRTADNDQVIVYHLPSLSSSEFVIASVSGGSYSQSINAPRTCRNYGRRSLADHYRKIHTARFYNNSEPTMARKQAISASTVGRENRSITLSVNANLLGTMRMLYL
jgi:hypothetical protein